MECLLLQTHCHIANMRMQQMAALVLNADVLICDSSGDQGADSATMMLDKLQQHPQEELSQIPEPATSQQSTYVYPLVLIVGCVLACAWRRSTLSKLLSNRRRVNVARSRYEV